MVPVQKFLASVRRGGVSAAAAMTLLLVALPVTPRAQDPTPAQVEPQDAAPDFSQDAPAHIAVIEGAATLERDGRASAAEENVPLLAGDRLRTEDGRVEVLFADSSVLDVDKYSNLDLLSESLLRVRSGRIHLSIARVTESLEYRIDAVGTSTVIRTAGEYRLGLSDPRAGETTVELAVITGAAELSSPSGRTLVRAGRRAFASEHTEPSLPVAFNSTEETEFDRWVSDQRDARLGLVSSQYLPNELRAYGGAFDHNGDWQYEPSYGYVWYPRVATTWQPYYYGGWSVVGSFGWTWIGAGSWCWPTHHYGRWNVGYGGRWFWSPGRYWGPGWVSWASYPGYVGWCPLGFNGHAAVALSAGHVGRAWTVVPSHTFNSRTVVVNNARSTAIQPTALSRFTRASAPQVAGVRAGVQPAQPLRSPSGVRAGVTSRDTRGVRAGESPSPRSVAVPRSGSSTWPPARDARQSVQPTTPSESRRAGVRPVMPPTGDTPDRSTPSRTPGDVARPRSGLTPSRPVQPPTDPTPSSPQRGMSRRVMPSDPPTPPPSGDGSSGWRRVAPPTPRSGGSDMPPPDQSRGSRAVPRSAPSSPPPSSAPPSTSSPRSRGRGDSGPPPSSSSSPRSSSSGDGRAAGRTGRGR